MLKNSEGGRLLSRLALVAIATSSFAACGGDDAPREVSLKAMTFNVLCSFCKPAEYGAWADRVPAFADILERHDPDLFGLQELTFPAEVDQILALKSGYAAVYLRNVPSGPLNLDDYPDATIFYRTSRFELRDQGNFWLSPTPDEPWSTGFAEGAQLPRLVTWAKLRELGSGRDLLFVTTHFDNNAPSQDKSAPLLLERTAAAAGTLPTIVVGDFNSEPTTSAYQTLVSGAYRLTNVFDLAQTWSVDTNQQPAPDYDLDSRIDHLFVAGDGAWQSEQWTVDLHVYGDPARYPSDHRPMIATLTF